MKYLAVLIALIIPVISYGYEIKTTETGNFVHWTPGTEIIVSLDPSMEDLSESSYATAEDSFNEWLGYMAGAVTISFVRQPCTDSSTFCISFGDDTELCGKNAVACTHRVYSRYDGDLIKVHIQFFNSYEWKSSRLLQNTMLHEIGHGLGMSHSFSRNAVMYHLVSSRHTSLNQDDINGIMTIYTGIEYPSVAADDYDSGCTVAWRNTQQSLYSLIF